MKGLGEAGNSEKPSGSLGICGHELDVRLVIIHVIFFFFSHVQLSGHWFGLGGWLNWF